ncbi:unnamed protein product, partial [Coregonus sp. 'balchen']
MALPHSPCQWSLQHTGTVCFVKDNPRQSYFICRFNIKIPLFTLLQYALCEGKQIWEQELYNQLTYHSPQSFFHTFAADVCILKSITADVMPQECQVGLHLASEQEAEMFQIPVEDKINQRANRQ